MVSVPVELLNEAAGVLDCEGYGSMSLSLLAFITAAPVREEGGAEAIIRALLDHVDRDTCQHDNLKRGGVQWTICEDCGRKWADDQGGFKPYVDPQPVAAARLYLSALATRDEAPANTGKCPCSLKADDCHPDCPHGREAPAEAGEGSQANLDLLSGFVQHLEDGKPVTVKDPVTLAKTLRHVLSTAYPDRAQPQAREEAQPVAWMMRERDGHMWAYSCDAEDARLAQADGFQCRSLYTTPPAPEAEAENLRVALHLFRAFVQRNVGQWAMGAGDHGHPIWAFVAEALGDANGAEVRDGPEYRFIQPENRQALAALQQDALSAAPGEEK